MRVLVTVPCSVTSHTFNFCLTSYKNHFCPFLSHALSYPISFPFPIDSPTPPPLSFSPLDPLLFHTPPIPHRFSHTYTPLPPTPFGTKNHHLMLFSLLQKLQDSPQHITQHLHPFLTLLTHMSDRDRISPYHIYTISCRQVMRIKKDINYRITKFFKLTYWESFGRQ